MSFRLEANLDMEPGFVTKRKQFLICEYWYIYFNGCQSYQ